MYFDLEDYHPEEPRVPQAMSAREGVLLAVILHLVALILIILAPRLGWWKPPVAPVVPAAEKVLRFVSLQPPIDRSRLVADAPRPSPPVVKTTPQPVSPAPVSNPAPPADTPPANTPPSPPAPPAKPDPPNATVIPDVVQAQPRPSGAAGLADSLHNLSRYLQGTNFSAPQASPGDTGAAISADFKGVDFTDWLARFKAQVMSNWMVPQAAMVQHGHVVFQFWVARDGRITDIHIMQPSQVDVFNSAAQNALVRSNPTVNLPAAYPSDKILFTVTFFYNEEVRAGGS